MDSARFKLQTINSDGKEILYIDVSITMWWKCHFNKFKDASSHLHSPALPSVVVSKGYIWFLPCGGSIIVPQSKEYGMNLMLFICNGIRHPASFVVFGHWPKEITARCKFIPIHNHPITSRCLNFSRIIQLFFSATFCGLDSQTTENSMEGGRKH